MVATSDVEPKPGNRSRHGTLGRRTPRSGREQTITMESTDVIVVGAGPTGLTLACELALAGVRCRLLERRVDQPNITRAFAVHARTLELLDARGLADEVLAHGIRVGQVAPVPSATLDLGELDTPYPMGPDRAAERDGAGAARPRRAARRTDRPGPPERRTLLKTPPKTLRGPPLTAYTRCGARSWRGPDSRPRCWSGRTATSRGPATRRSTPGGRRRSPDGAAPDPRSSTADPWTGAPGPAGTPARGRTRPDGPTGRGCPAAP